MGASRARLIWLLFDETLVLSALGLAAGLVLSSWITGYLSAIHRASISTFEAITRSTGGC